MIRENDYNKNFKSLKIEDKNFLDGNKEEFLFKFKNSSDCRQKGYFQE